MLVKYKFKNLYTEYSAEGRYPHTMQRKPCYGTISGGLKSDQSSFNQKYKIRIYTTTDKLLKDNGNNFCFVDIEKYLRYLQEVIDFTFEIKPEPEDHRVELNIDYTGPTGRHHLFLLTNIRPLYEYPYSLCMHDAIKLYESGECPGINIIDCFHICLTTSGFSIGGGHTVLANNCVVMPLKKKDIYNMCELNKPQNDWYPSICPLSDSDKSGLNKFDECEIENLINTYHRRHKKYLATYEKIRRYI